MNCSPNGEYFQYKANALVERSGVKPAQVKLVQIHIGGGFGGWIQLVNGKTIRVE